MKKYKSKHSSAVRIWLTVITLILASTIYAQQEAWKPVARGAGAAPLGSWTKVPVGTKNKTLKIAEVSVGNTNHVWAVGEDKKIYRLGAKGWIAESAGIAVGVGHDGTVIGINESNDVFKRIKAGKWEQIPNLKLSHISVGSDKIMWGIFKNNDTYEVYKLAATTWEPVQDPQTKEPQQFVQLSVNAQGTVLALDKNNKPFKCTVEQVAQSNLTRALKQQKNVKQSKKAKKSKKRPKRKKKKAKKKKTSKKAKTKKKTKKAPKKKKKGKKKTKNAKKKTT